MRLKAYMVGGLNSKTEEVEARTTYLYETVRGRKNEDLD